MNNPTEHSGIYAYKQRAKANRLILTALLLFTMVLAVAAICAGAANITYIEAITSVLGYGSDKSKMVVWNIRLPRVLSGIIAGAGLSVAGCVMQTCLRNPLASPSTLGISNAAAFGANLAIVFLAWALYGPLQPTRLQ